MSETTAYSFAETPVKQLMQRRVSEILLVCSTYDSFVLEEDGRVDEQIFQEYASLHLRYPPRFTQVSSEDEALDALSTGTFDLVISMLNIGGPDAVRLANRVHAAFPSLPVVLLSHSVRDRAPARIHSPGETNLQDFAWLGDDAILLAIVKLIEDRMNVGPDVAAAGVQVIILVEDSVRYYSGYLPVIYRTLIQQARNLMEEGLNEWEQTMRMRCRPKILLATTFEEAVGLYDRYHDNVLGVITDVSYPREGAEDARAGFELCRRIRERDSDLPILLQSSDKTHRDAAREWDAGFIHKEAKTLYVQLQRYMRRFYGFGDILFRDPETGAVVAQASDLRELQAIILNVPNESVVHHFRRNDVSRWLRARALFSLSEVMLCYHPDLADPELSKRGVHDIIAAFRRYQSRGKIARFDRFRHDEYASFSRIGEGSLGGKGRGLAFVDHIIKKHRVRNAYPGVNVSIPRTVVLGTDLFSRFLEDDRAARLFSGDLTDAEMVECATSVEFDDDLRSDLRAILAVARGPLAVRSSSLLEDSSFQPFAGIYNTFFLSNSAASDDQRLSDLEMAIKCVYASTFFRAARDYRVAVESQATDERMGVIIQEITGTVHGERCYPTISGTARSVNYYPTEYESTEDGVAYLALGLGKSVVDGMPSLRFNPQRPDSALQLTDTEAAVGTTQKKFYALRVTDKPFLPSTDEASPLVVEDIRKGVEDPSFPLVASTYDRNDRVLRDGWLPPGKPVITMAGVLRYPTIPVAEIVRDLLDLSSRELGVPVEIEFAVDLNRPAGEPKIFSFLQVRPIIPGSETADVDLSSADSSHSLVFSRLALGNGAYRNVKNVVYVRPGAFDPATSRSVAEAIGAANEQLASRDEKCILIVPGRLGSRDPWLGIPAAWHQICQARVICEYELENLAVDPSQGSHFFHNITALGIGYLTVRRAGAAPGNPDHVDFVVLDLSPAWFENEFVRAVSFAEPLETIIDGKNRIAAVRYPLGESTAAE